MNVKKPYEIKFVEEGQSVNDEFFIGMYPIVSSFWENEKELSICKLEEMIDGSQSSNVVITLSGNEGEAQCKLEAAITFEDESKKHVELLCETDEPLQKTINFEKFSKEGYESWPWKNNKNIFELS